MAEDPGEFIRPEFEILGDSSLVPGDNLIQPAPTAFTHEAVGATPFSYRGDEREDGSLRAGTPVVLVREDDAGRSWVVDGQGLYVAVRSEALRPLPTEPA